MAIATSSTGTYPPPGVPVALAVVVVVVVAGAGEVALASTGMEFSAKSLFPQLLRRVPLAAVKKGTGAVVSTFFQY